jgi:hypothetical protein
MDLTEAQYFELVIIMIGPGGLLRVIPHVYAVLILFVGFCQKTKQLNLDI